MGVNAARVTDLLDVGSFQAGAALSYRGQCLLAVTLHLVPMPLPSDWVGCAILRRSLESALAGCFDANTLCSLHPLQQLERVVISFSLDVYHWFFEGHVVGEAACKLSRGAWQQAANSLEALHGGCCVRCAGCTSI